MHNYRAKHLKTIFDLISKDLGSDSTKNIFKTTLTTDDIVNNLDF